MDVVALAETSSDQQLLELIARNPDLVAASDEWYLLEKIDEIYWRMRVVEGLLQVAPERALALGNRYPIEVVHAIGRLEARERLPFIRELFLKSRDNPHFLSIYAWALGRIGDETHLREVREAMEDLKKAISSTDA